MLFLFTDLELRIAKFFPPVEFWLVNSNFRRGSRTQGIESNKIWLEIFENQPVEVKVFKAIAFLVLKKIRIVLGKVLFVESLPPIGWNWKFKPCPQNRYLYQWRLFYRRVLPEILWCWTMRMENLSFKKFRVYETTHAKKVHYPAHKI